MYNQDDLDRVTLILTKIEYILEISDISLVKALAFNYV